MSVLFTSQKLRVAAIFLLSLFLFIGAEGGQLEDMAVEIEELTAKIADLEAKNSRVITIQDNLDAIREQLVEKAEGILAKEKELDELSFLQGVYSSAYRIVPKVAKGHPMGTFRLKDGREIENAVFAAPVRGGISVATGKGPMTISIDQIPAEQASSFNLPGQIPGVSVTLQQVILSRPETVGSSGSGVADSSSEKGKKDEEEEKPKNASAERARAARVARVEMVARNEVRWDKVDQLKLEDEKFTREKKRIKSQRDNKESELKQGKIKRDPRAVTAALSEFDRKIADLDKKSAAVNEQIQAIIREIE